MAKNRAYTTTLTAASAVAAFATVDKEPAAGAEAEDVERGAAWEGVATFLDTPTDEQMPRLIHSDGVTWRELPLPLFGKFEDDHGGGGLGGGPVSVKVGRVDTVEIVGSELRMTGTFDPTPDGLRGAAWAEDGTARVSVDTNPLKYRVTAPADVVEADQQEMQDWIDGDVEDVKDMPVDENGRVILEEGEQSDYIIEFLETEIMGLTMVGFSAFAESKIALVAGGGGVLRRLSFAAQIAPRGSFVLADAAGMMFALYPDDAAALTTGDVPSGDVHVTLCAKVMGLTGEQADALATEVALTTPPVAGTITGVAEFAEGEDGIPVVLLVDAPAAYELHEALREAVVAMGGEVASTYGCTCHVTLGYATTTDEAAALVAEGRVFLGREFTASNLSAVNGDERDDYSLAGRDSADDAGLTASATGAAPERPPLSWFNDPGLDEPTPILVTAEGRVLGHAAAWGTCHTGFPGTCKSAPSSPTAYAYFNRGRVLTTPDAEMAWSGPITLETVHAGTSLSAERAIEHYENTGLVVADVRVGEDEHGIWIAGALRPDVPDVKARALRGAGLSGDWRWINGELELIGLLACNTQGFPIPQPDALVAGGQTRAITGVGIVALDAERVTARLQALDALAQGGLQGLASLAAG